MQRGSVIGSALFWALLLSLAPDVCAAAPPAAEQLGDPPAAQSSAPLTTRHWYGWQTFAADGAASALFLSAVADDHNSTLFTLSGLTFGLGAPAIHVSHGNWELALASLGLRFAGPFVGAMIGSQSDSRASEAATSADRSSKWAITGVGIGGLVASAIDGLLLSYDTRAPSPSAKTRQQLLAGSVATAADGARARRISGVFRAFLSEGVGRGRARSSDAPRGAPLFSTQPAGAQAIRSRPPGTFPEGPRTENFRRPRAQGKISRSV